jgi:hypothetical protein
MNAGQGAAASRLDPTGLPSGLLMRSKLQMAKCRPAKAYRRSLIDAVEVDQPVACSTDQA